MTNIYQERIFLHLSDDSEEVRIIKKIVRSPLGLASDIITCLFTENMQSLKESLDNIKKFVAGINRAEKLSNQYALAGYYPLMFSFHQYFNSSYRARQGKVLEEILKNIVRNFADCDRVPDKTSEMRAILSESFQMNIPKLDIDVLGCNAKQNKIIVIQLRSRDDTGGTTAKGSLVDMLRELLRMKKQPKSDILYLVAVWDKRDSLQKNSTISKMYSSLKGLIKTNRETFEDHISEGINIQNHLTLRMAYGTDEIMQAIFEWIGKPDRKILHAIREFTQLVENWDDLWIAYAIASLEIETESFLNISNIRLINTKFDKNNFRFDFTSYKSITSSIDQITTSIAPIWKENTIPLPSLSDKIHYIRDLLFLKAIYEKIKK